MKLSILELGTVSPGETEAQALADALETAREADRLGFERIWFAEHHLTPLAASHHPELLIAAAAMQTRGIRLGSGGVLLNHYSAFKVAEMFKQLEAMCPGRIDLGMGRQKAGPVLDPVADKALRRERDREPPDDYPGQVAQVLAWLHNAFPENHPFAFKPLVPSVPSTPRAWMLGATAGSAELCAHFGIGYAFAGFVNQQDAAEALQAYRRRFSPTPFGEGEPRSILALNVTAADTAEEARERVLCARAYYARVARQGIAARMPTVAQAAAELSPQERDEPTRIVGGRWPRFVAGDAAQVRQDLEAMAAAGGADEVMVQDLAPELAARRTSHRLLAQAFGLAARP